jgi:ABC-type spermidine/putrescine transport system permease subunit II
MARVLILFLAAAPLLALVLLGEAGLDALLHTPVWVAAAFRTLLIAEVSVPVALLLAVPAVLGVIRCSPAPRRWLTWLCALPVLLPPAWVAAGLRDAATRSGFPGAHIAALIAAHAAPAAAVSFLVLLGALDRCDWAAIETMAAQGAGWLHAIWVAAGRHLAEGLALSATAAFAVAAGWTIPDTLAPLSHPTLGVLLASARETADGGLAAVGLLLAMICLAPLGLVLSLRWLRRPAWADV